MRKVIHELSVSLFICIQFFMCCYGSDTPRCLPVTHCLYSFCSVAWPGITLPSDMALSTNTSFPFSLDMFLVVCTYGQQLNGHFSWVLFCFPPRVVCSTVLTPRCIIFLYDFLYLLTGINNVFWPSCHIHFVLSSMFVPPTFSVIFISTSCYILFGATITFELHTSPSCLPSTCHCCHCLTPSPKALPGSGSNSPSSYRGGQSGEQPQQCV